MVTEGRAKVYAIVLDMFWKSVFSGLAAVAFVAVGIKLLYEPTWPLATAESFLSATLYQAIKHYLPTRNE